MKNAVYHAGPRYDAPLCGTRGSGNRFNVVVLGPKDWNQLDPKNRCSKCCEAILKKKAST